jgi:hypothetical protein
MLLNEISNLYRDFPPGTIIDHEGPDFLVEQNGHILGIEIEDYIRGQTSEGSKKRRKEIIWKKIIDKAQSEFEADCTIPVIASFSWFPHRQPQRIDIKSLAKNIASIVANNIPSEVSSWVEVGYDELGNTPLEEFLHSIIVCRTKKRGTWSFDEGDFTEIKIDEIEWLISSKNNKVSQYLLVCNSIWLIIVADGEYISSYADLSQEIIEHSYQAQFERVLFYDRVRQSIFQLTIH